VNAISIDRPSLGRAAQWLAVGVLLLGAIHPAAAGSLACEARAAAAHQVLAARNLDNWEPLSDRAVLIWMKHSERAYLVTVDRALHGLTAAPVIDLVSGDHGRNLSACGRDGITIGAGAGERAVARIVSIERLSARRTAELDPGARPALARSFRV